MDRLSGTAVFQSHGTIDPILPYASAEALNQMLQNAGVENRFHSFKGPHTDRFGISDSDRGIATKDRSFMSELRSLHSILQC